MCTVHEMIDEVLAQATLRELVNVFSSHEASIPYPSSQTLSEWRADGRVLSNKLLVPDNVVEAIAALQAHGYDGPYFLAHTSMYGFQALRVTIDLRKVGINIDPLRVSFEGITQWEERSQSWFVQDKASGSIVFVEWQPSQGEE